MPRKKVKEKIVKFCELEKKVGKLCIICVTPIDRLLGALYVCVAQCSIGSTVHTPKKVTFVECGYKLERCRELKL